MRMRHALVATLALAIASSPAVAQVCIGFPTVSGQRDAALGAQFGDGFSTFLGQFGANMDGPLAARVEAGITMIDGADDNMVYAGVTGTYDFPLEDVAFTPCGLAGFSIGRMGDATSISVPVGVGVGVSIDAGPDMAFSPFAAPQIVWSRVSANGFSDSSTDFGLSAGATFSGAAFYIQAAITKIFVQGSSAAFGILVGMIL